MKQNILNIARRFKLIGEPKNAEPYGGGHINDTYLLDTDSARYILQRVNTNVFTRPVELMENIVNVTAFLRDAISRNGGNPARETLTFIPALDGSYYLDSPDEGFWRCYIYVDDALTYQQATEELFYESARALGRFQMLLDGYPASGLHEVIADFHNTSKRFETFLDAYNSNPCGRVESAREEIRFVMDRKDEMGLITSAIESGRLPLRVAHNDTKLNNILIDAATGRGLCVLDLDTVMPGSALYDFGDSVRFGAGTALEDEPDVSKMKLSLPLYEAFVKGYLECAALSADEHAMLSWGAKLMTLECGMRFLTDYLMGDKYFKTSRPGHNLDRCRTQFALAADMERHWDEMAAIARKY